jgi:DNA mismatch repair protein MutS2
MKSVYPSDIEAKLGFSQIRDLLVDRCRSVVGKEYVSEMAFGTDHKQVVSLLEETEAFRQLLVDEAPLPSLEVADVREILERLRIENTFPEPGEVHDIFLMIQTGLEVVGSKLKVILAQGTEHRAQDEEKKFIPDPASPIAHRPSLIAHRLSPIAHRPSPIAHRPSHISHRLSPIAALISRILTDQGEIKDNASKELQRIRREVKRLESEVGKRIEKVFVEAQQQGWVDDSSGVTVREGRLVIPFRESHKRKIQGVVHDVSATGHTVFVEPVELFEMNNRVRELHYEARREIIRILTSVANEIRPEIDLLLELQQILGWLDFVRAKAKLAIDIGACLCKNIVQRPHLQWHEAVHPLLLFSLKRSNRKPVPLTISLDSAQRILVVSGPNAGGKSVCLKTVGLIQYMVQCGLLPPVREDSEFGIFDQIMIDIGDQQSIDDDLSTYTSKLEAMKVFLENLNPGSLFLIDEMGSGTDPAVGGAIAEAALLAMANTGAWGVVTTHYGNLKAIGSLPLVNNLGLPSVDDKEIRDLAAQDRSEDQMSREANKGGKRKPIAQSAQRETHIANGAMLFDMETLKPLYILQQGKSGSSFAVEIARSIGFPDDILDEASRLSGGSQLDFEQQLQQLEVEKQKVVKRKQELDVADDFLKEMIEKYEGLYEDLQSKKKQTIEAAREEASEILDGANKLIERTIKEIREAEAEKEQTKKIRKRVEEEKKKIRGLPSVDDQGIRDLTTRDRSEDQKSREANEGEKRRPEARSSKRTYQKLILDKKLHFSPNLDIRGMRGDEAFTAIQRFVDDAILVSAHELVILHGKGTGALREITREYLQSVPEIKQFGDAPIERGGAGVTIVIL